MSKNIEVGACYYHFKRKENDPTHERAYTVISVGFDTEREERVVIYRPLYTNTHLDDVGATCYVRPYEMFIEDVERGDYSGPRFFKIEDEETINKLKKFETDV